MWPFRLGRVPGRFNPAKFTSCARATPGRSRVLRGQHRRASFGKGRRALSTQSTVKAHAPSERHAVELVPNPSHDLLGPDDADVDDHPGELRLDAPVDLGLSSARSRRSGLRYPG